MLPKHVRKYLEKCGCNPADGQRHEEHHLQSRRNFLIKSGLAFMGTGLSLQGFPITSLSPNPLWKSLMEDDSDRVLVLIRLQGGNDGLNMVIPRGNDEYYNIRPTIAMGESDMWGLSDEFGMPNRMDRLQPMWEEGKMKVIHNVGYPQANYSHFRSSDIWATASGSREYEETGWIGRYLNQEFDAYIEASPVVPPAVQIGIQTNLLFRGPRAEMTLALSSPSEFYQIAQTGQLYDTSTLRNHPHDIELGFVRSVANAAFRYSESIQEAYNRGSTEAAYEDYDLSEQLSIVARLIKGGLGTKVYMVRIGGFDNHSNQLNRHPDLLEAIAASVRSFFDDLEDSSMKDKVLAITFSEFGRTIFENGSFGTDHGTGAPMLLFGHNTGGNGFYGEAPDLLDLDQYGDPFFSVDFRDVYSNLLTDWLGLEPDLTDHLLLRESSPINGLVPTATVPKGSNRHAVLLGHHPSKSQPGNFEIKYSIRIRGNVVLLLKDRSGQTVRVLLDTFSEKGSFTHILNPGKLMLPPGDYFYVLQSGGRAFHRRLRLL